MLFIGIVAYAVFLATLPLLLHALGFIVTLVIAKLPVLAGGTGHRYIVASLATLVVLMVGLLGVAYVLNEQPFNMNYVASDRTISLARVLVFPAGILSGVLFAFFFGRDHRLQ